ncbi:MAG: hypothetical protein KDK70_22130 [Myxococcales bacterium]|nr:hypothetical protein [Myxococcales bacterium]
MTPIRLRRAPEAALGYHVLAHLPLRRDAASLFDAGLPARSWVEPLHRAYAAAPGRLVVQALGLRHADGGLDALADDPPAGLRDDAGRRLLACFLEAVEHERPAFMAAWEADAARAEARRAEVEAVLVEPLAVLRGALWEQQGPAPPLTVLDCPALGPCGRGGATPHERRVAVSLAAPVEHLLCQIFHEEVHPVTDPVVREGLPEIQDTRAGSAGHAVHAALEAAAIEVGEAVILARAPRWADAYARWRARFGARAAPVAPRP